MIHNPILEIPAILKQAISCRPIGTVHKSPARSAGSGRGGCSRPDRTPHYGNGCRDRKQDNSHLNAGNPAEPSLQDGAVIRTQSLPGTLCRAFMRGPFGTQIKAIYLHDNHAPQVHVICEPVLEFNA